MMKKIMESGTIEKFVIAAVLLTGLVYVFLSSNRDPAGGLSFFFSLSSTDHQNLTMMMTTEKAPEPPDDLGVALAEAATENKTVIVAVVNRAYTEQDGRSETTTTMLDLFLESFWVGGEETRRLVENLLVVAVDEAAYERCRFKRLHCYRMVMDQAVDYGGEKVYMSTEFINMMWTRTLFLLHVLQRGYSFIFTDTDVMWLRNPFPILNQNERMDLQISVDKFNANGSSENQLINTGFYFIRSNNKTISLFEKWYSMKDNSTGKKEQDVLLDLMSDGIVNTLGLRAHFLDTRYFSGFCEDSKDVRAVATVHSNCCRHINAKVADLTAVLRDWKQFNSGNQTLTANVTSSFKWSPHVGCVNSWRGR